MKRRKNTEKAVSEIVGTALLLGIAIALFAIVQVIAFNVQFNEPGPSARITATIVDDGSNDKVVVIHQGGEKLPLDNTKLVIAIDSNAPVTINNPSIHTSTDNGDNYWNIGEKIVYDTGENLNYNNKVRISVVDTKHNSLVMQGSVKGGS